MKDGDLSLYGLRSLVPAIRDKVTSFALHIQGDNLLLPGVYTYDSLHIDITLL